MFNELEGARNSSVNHYQMTDNNSSSKKKNVRYYGTLHELHNVFNVERESTPKNNFQVKGFKGEYTKHLSLAFEPKLW